MGGFQKAFTRVRAACALLSVMIVAGGTQAQAGPSRALVQHPVVAASDAHLRPIDRFWAEVRRGVTYQEFATLRRDIMSAPVDRGGFGLMVPAAADSAASAAEEPQQNSFAFGTADIDADGKEEVFTWTLNQGHPAEGTIDGVVSGALGTLVVRDGDDGSGLIEVNAPGLLSVGVYDLTADDTPEIVLVEIGAVSASAVPFVAGVSTIVEHYRIRVISSLGDEVWRMAGEGVYVSATAGTTIVGAKDLLLGPRSIGDADGDGVDDLGVERTSFVLTLIPFLGIPQGIRLILDGYDGSTGGSAMARVTADAVWAAGACVPFVICAPQGGRPAIVALGDVSGDGVAEIATLSSVPARWTLDVSSAQARRLWGREGIGDFFGPVLGSLELTGDGRAEVVLASQVSGGEVLDARTGTRLYVDHYGLLSGIASGDQDGDGVGDYAVQASLPDHPISFAMISGRTGHEIWHVGFDRPSNRDEIVDVDLHWCACSPDLNGDGFEDLLLIYDLSTFDPEAFVFIHEYHLVAFEGRTGAQLWSGERVGELGQLPRPILGDLNGNGSDDFLSSGVLYPGDSVSIPVIDGTMMGAVGALEFVTAADRFVASLLLDVADVSGDAADEVILGSQEVGEVGDRYLAHILSLAGELWVA